MDRVETLSLRGNGITLAADALGPVDGPPILFLHGGGQTRHSWRGAVKVAAARGYRAISVDLRGHGDSDWAPDGQYDIDVAAEDLREVIRQLGEPPIIVGASYGGILGLMVAASDPDMVRILVLVDVTPRIEMEGTMEIAAFMGSARDGFASLDEAADAVAAYLPHRQRPKDTSGLSRNLRLRDGRYYWHWDPAFLNLNEKAKERLKSPNMFELAAMKISIPTLLIRGGRSRVVSEEGVREFLTLVPHADYVNIDDAHHMVAGDANDAFNSAVFDFLDAQTGRGRPEAA